MGVAINITQKNGFDILYYVGPINEEAEVHLTQAIPRLGKKVVINFKQVEYVNSCGVRSWINFMRQISDKDVTFEECTPEIVTQLNMIPSFRGRATINSVYGAYQCDSCKTQALVLFKEGQNMPRNESDPVPSPGCPKCGKQMEMQEIEEEFFAFKSAS
jgi:anti-anti-sigma regulatory factor